MDMVNNIFGLFGTLVTKFIEWIDKIFAWFEEYTDEGYSKWFMVALIMYVASLFMKVNIKTGSKAK